MQPTINPLGDSSLVITFDSILNEDVNKQVLSLFKYLTEKNIYGIKDIIPAYASLTIVYDVVKLRDLHNVPAYDHVNKIVEKALNQKINTSHLQQRTLNIPVCYDVALGTDLLAMANEKGISVNKIIGLHSSVTYRVYMIGFLPGFAYMGTVDDKIATPRKVVPEKNIVAGSVGIADNQTGIYPFNSPGGWNIIGRTPEPLFYSKLREPCLLQPGDLVKFEPITLQEFERMK